MKQKAAHTASEQIMKLVHSLGLTSGERLPGERDLAERLGWSRNTVREAISALAARGLVEIRMRSGVYLCDSGPDAICTGQRSCGDAVDALTVLGPALVERVCTRCTDDDHERAERVTARLGRALVNRNPHDAWLGLMAFYGGLAQSTGNALLEHSAEEVATAGLRACDVLAGNELPHDALQTFFAAHVEMLQAMRRRERIQARQLAEDSLTAFGRMLQVAGYAPQEATHDA